MSTLLLRCVMKEGFNNASLMISIQTFALCEAPGWNLNPRCRANGDTSGFSPRMPRLPYSPSGTLPYRVIMCQSAYG